ncbi:MAG: YfiR family protein [Verrucomicrobiales bacterium]|nr:YfiR family protein [Verrucomicrobiales bacterium]
MPRPRPIVPQGRRPATARRPAMRALVLAFLFPFLLESSVRAAAPTEYEVKAAFLLNFARFVEWPADVFPEPAAPLVIGIIGCKELADTLPRMITQQTAQGRPIQIRELQSLESTQACQVLFIGRTAGASTSDELLKSVRKRPVLTVGDAEDFNAKGGIIRFLLVDKSVRFDVHARAAADAALKISSKLLAVARQVITAP